MFWLTWLHISSSGWFYSQLLWMCRCPLEHHIPSLHTHMYSMWRWLFVSVHYNIADKLLVSHIYHLYLSYLICHWSSQAIEQEPETQLSLNSWCCVLCGCPVIVVLLSVFAESFGWFSWFLYSFIISSFSLLFMTSWVWRSGGLRAQNDGVNNIDFYRCMVFAVLETVITNFKVFLSWGLVE